MERWIDIDNNSDPLRREERNVLGMTGQHLQKQPEVVMREVSDRPVARPGEMI
jgi:hypothetical protein